MSGRTYAVIGTGALGGYYGARLNHAGFDVHYLLRSDYEHVRTNGLRIDSKDGDFTLPTVNAYRNAADMPRCDVVIVSLKTTQNHLLGELLPPVIADDGCVLVLQNGLGMEGPIGEIVGHHRVVGGLAFLCSNKLGPGHIHHMDYGQITLAEHTPDGSPGGETNRIKQIAADLEAAGIPVRTSRDLVKSRWKKLVWNVPFNGLSVVLDATTDRIMADKHARILAEQLMAEVVAAAAACGHPLDANITQIMLDQTATMTPYRTSMKIDHDAGRLMEIEAIFGNPWRAAKQAGLDCPRLESLYRLLGFLNGGGSCPPAG